MNLAEWALKNRALVLFFVIVLSIGGVYSFLKMSKLEDPAITVKQAVVVTVYPGADAHQVELEVTDVLEKEIKTMGNIDHIESKSMDDVSTIMVELRSTVAPEELQQHWDILRRRVESAQAKLPSGSQKSIVKDDFGDVYGMFYVITSDGFSKRELTHYAQKIKSTVQNVEGVNNAQLYGEDQSCVYVDLQESTMAQLGIHPAKVLATIQKQSEPVYAGYYESGEHRVKLELSEPIDTIQRLSNIMISGYENDLIRLKDIAHLHYGSVDPIREAVFYKNSPSIALAISAEKGENVIEVGEKVDKILNELKSTVLPIGIDFKKISFQPNLVQDAISVFMQNLIESILIVVLVVVLSMGIRSGYVIGVNLLIVVLGSLLVLYMVDGTLQRVSLGSFIVAMGMLVDNAIVIVDGIVMDVKKGVTREKALVQIAKQTAMPLLGATFIAILTFFPIYLSPDTTGEYVKDLFIVLAVSLFLSWVLALVYAPIQMSRVIKKEQAVNNFSIGEDVYQGRIYCLFRQSLRWTLNSKRIILITTIGVLGITIWAFSFVKKGFFPDLNYTQLYIEYKLPNNVSGEATLEDLKEIEKLLLEREDVKSVLLSMGGTPARYNLVRTVPEPGLNYGELIVDFHSSDGLKSAIKPLQDELNELYPEAFVRLKRYNLMYKEFPIQYQISGPDPAVLRLYCDSIKAIMSTSEKTMLVTDNWGEKQPYLSINYDQVLGQKSTLSRSDIALSLMSATGGLPLGNYYEGSDGLPIYFRTVDNRGEKLENLNNVPIWSLLPSLPQFSMKEIQLIKTGAIPLDQMVDDMVGSRPLNSVAPTVGFNWKTPVVRRYDGERAMAAQCNVKIGCMAEEVRSELAQQIDLLELPIGYHGMWQGEYLASQKSKKYLFSNIPLALVLIIGILIALFKDYKKPLIIVLCLPLAIVGVVAVMLLTGKEFGFVAIVGILGLVGMMIKNSVVLIDEIDLQLSQDKPLNEAVIDATVSRMRPVFLAALTTILGMLPLINDDMFGALAATIMGGLFMGTITTLYVLPLLYVLFIKSKSK